jgi:uncharacterized integral membrane protein
MDDGNPEVPPALVPAPATSPEAGPAQASLGVDRAGARRSGRPSDKVGPTRLSGAWTAAIVAVVLVVAMLIFILDNEHQVSISFVSLHGHLPLGVALLFSAVIGAVIVLVCGTARILQLRRVARRRSRSATRPAVTALAPNVPPVATAVGPGPEEAEPAP